VAHPAIDETGRRYGLLTVVGRAPRIAGPTRFARWRCLCDCGREVVCWGNNLRSGSTSSCGSCVPREPGRLSDEAVLEIRSRRARGDATARLAADFGVSQPLISAITSGRLYAGVGGPVFSRTRRKRPTT